MSKQFTWDRCLYCDASIAGDDAHVAMLHDPYCPHGKSLRKLDGHKIRGDNHAESLRAIRDMCGAETVDVERIRLWASDSLSGYTEPLESSLLKLQDVLRMVSETLQDGDVRGVGGEVCMPSELYYRLRDALHDPVTQGPGHDIS